MSDGTCSRLAPFAALELKHRRNPLARRGPYGARESKVINRVGAEAALEEISAWPGYRPTPLRSLDALAHEINLSRIWYKDEAERFGLGSFKALGGAYAVYRLLASIVAAQTGEPVSARALASGEHRALTQAVTVTSATDGNHGRSVAWGAQMFGCHSVIYLHEHVSRGRERAIAQYGAEMVRVPGNYDDSVHQAQRDATSLGRFVVSDTSYPGYVEPPIDVMHGYTVMVQEVMDQLPASELPSHCFVQAGVGGLAAAVCAHLWQALESRRPRFIVVEPDRADCLYRSAKAGAAARTDADLDTLMAGLSAGETSLLAWEVLAGGCDDFVLISDEAAAATMRLLAADGGGDPRVVAGESAVAGLAAVLIAGLRPAERDGLGLTRESRVLVFGTEGATDPETYQRIVGSAPEEVAAGGGAEGH